MAGLPACSSQQAPQPPPPVTCHPPDKDSRYLFSSVSVYRYAAVCLRVVRLDRTLRRREERATFRRERRALFTATELRNALATSGSRTTTFVSVATRSAYFPRTSLPKSERLYSGLSSSTALRLPFFINPPFLSCYHTSADNANFLTFLGMGHDQKTILTRIAKGYEAAFPDRMVGIGARHREYVAEDC